MKLCTICSEPSIESRCEKHAHPARPKLSSTKRGYDHNWRKLSERARELQPWCTTCHTDEDLTTDHLRWPARSLRDVDVLCRSCNAKKGEAPGRRQPRSPGDMTLNEGQGDPGGKAFDFTQFGVNRG